MARREYSHTVFNQVPETAREEAYADADRMAVELGRRNKTGQIEIEVVRKNPRTFDIFIVFKD